MNLYKDIQQLKSLRILVIGDSCVDRYHYGLCERMSPEAPVPVFKHQSFEDKKGMAANVFENFKSLGVSPELITNQELIIKSRYIDKKTKQHLLRVDEGEVNKTKPLDFSDIKAGLKDFDAIVFSDYNKGFVTDSLVREIIRKNKNIKFFVDSKKNDLSCYENCIIKINEKEKEENRKLPEKCELIITMGKKGAKWREQSIPVNNVEVFDVCGAGDTFLVGLVIKYLLTKDILESIRFANMCASISVQKFGTYQIKWEDIREYEKKYRN